MKLPGQKKVLREDLKESPSWIGPLLDAFNTLVETAYMVLNKNITLQDNLYGGIKEITVKTLATYPIQDPIEFPSPVRTRAVECRILQVYEKKTFIPIACSIAWSDSNGKIIINNITGLEPSKIYLVRVWVS